MSEFADSAKIVLYRDTIDKINQSIDKTISESWSKIKIVTTGIQPDS